jgi:hypothetical protein
MNGFHTGRNANGTPYDGQNNQQLQTPHAQSGHHQDVADRIRKRFWRDSTRRQKDWTKRYQLYLRDDTCRNPQYPKGQNCHLRSSQIFVPRKQIHIELGLQQGAISSITPASYPNAWLTSQHQSLCGTACSAPWVPNICARI